MKIRFISLATFFLFSFIIFGCSKDIDTTGRNSNEDMYIIPQNPTIADEIKIVDDICAYDVLKSLTITDGQIEYVRNFNSQMGQPCVAKTDTLSIGQLVEGDYMLVYKLVDLSPMVLDTIAAIDTLYFTVSK